MTRLMAKLNGPTGRSVLVYGSVVLASALLAVLLYVVGRQGDQIDALSSALSAQRGQAVKAGQSPVAPPPQQILATPTPMPGATGPVGPAGPGPSDEQVQVAVAAYFAAHPVTPGRAPTPAEIAVAVINYLTAHPPAAGPVGATGAVGPSGGTGPAGAKGDPGPGPTAQQISDAVTAYLTEHPPPAGPQGPGPSAEQISKAVSDYIGAHPLPLCPTGTKAGTLTVVTTDGPQQIVACVKSTA